MSQDKEKVITTYKLDGIRFASKEELIENMWPLYDGRMSKEEFEKYAAENMTEEEKAAT